MDSMLINCHWFQSACLPLLLRESGLSYFAIGAMKLLFLPWVCKPLYAPFIETTRTKRYESPQQIFQVEVVFLD